MSSANPIEFAALAAINHVLRAEPWALGQLQPFAGKVAQFAAPPFTLRVRVAADGALDAADEAEPSAVNITISPAVLGKVVAGGAQAALSETRIEGDAAFARAIGEVVRQVRWDAEEDLSRLVGDIAAHRIVSGTRNAGGEALRAGGRMAQNVAEFLVYEDSQLLRPLDVAGFAGEVARLRDDVDSLERRIGGLERH
jgi:ubiquinone biosynthesis protein UbiJ